MSLFVLDKELFFPPINLAEPDGLLAIGGDLSSESLLLAYRNGIFPWYGEGQTLWWCPDPRFVLYPEDLKISKSARFLFKRNDPASNGFEFSINKAFSEVIHQCKQTPRSRQDGTWITNEVEKAFIKMHELGYAHSAEVWKNDQLLGGLYGIKLGKVFFGESMFSKESNASRFAFIRYVQELKREGIELIDCQVYTRYLESFGAKMIPRSEFIKKLETLIS